MRWIVTLALVVCVTVALKAQQDRASDDDLRAAAAGDAAAKARLLKVVDEKTLERLLRFWQKPPVEELLKNGDFSRGFKHWERVTAMRSGRVGVFEVAKDKNNRPFFHYSRLGSADGSTVMLRQKVSRKVDFKHLFVYLHGRVIRHDLDSSGWWSTKHGGQGEYPLMVRIEYLDKYEKKHMWAFGVLTKKNTEPFENYWILPARRWGLLWVDMLDDRGLLKPNRRKRNNSASIPYPAVLRYVWVGGKGWEYEGEVRRVGLLGVRDVDGFMWLVEGALEGEKERRELFEAVLRRGLPDEDFAAWRKFLKAAKQAGSDEWARRKEAKKVLEKTCANAFPVFLALRYTRWKRSSVECRAAMMKIFHEPVRPAPSTEHKGSR